MGIKGEEVQAKGIGNIFNKIVVENFPNLEKILPIYVQEAFRTPNQHDQNKTSPQDIIIKEINRKDKEKLLRAVQEKNKHHIKVNPSK
jgi:hypothetical protein